MARARLARCVCVGRRTHLCPPHAKTSPKRTSSISRGGEPSELEKDSTCAPLTDAGCGGSATRHTPLAPAETGAPTCAPSSRAVMAEPAGAKPHSWFSAPRCKTAWLPRVSERRKGAVLSSLSAGSLPPFPCRAMRRRRRRERRATTAGARCAVGAGAGARRAANSMGVKLAWTAVTFLLQREKGAMGKPQTHTPLPSLTLKKPSSTGLSKKPFTTPARGVGWSALASLTVNSFKRGRAPACFLAARSRPLRRRRYHPPTHARARRPSTRLR